MWVILVDLIKFDTQKQGPAVLTPNQVGIDD